MDPMLILSLIAKGVSVIELAIDAGKNAGTAITAVKNLIKGGQDGTLTDADIDAADKVFDDQLAEFNAPFPPKIA